MDLSIIIVSWRVKDLLRENLKSIFESKTKYSFEVFVVDNNSAAGTIEMLSKEFPQVQLLANNYNAGFAAGLEMDLPLIPKVYGRVGSMAASLDEIPDARFFAETGIKLGGDAFQMVFPIYISDPFPGEDRLDFRFFYSFGLPLD